jgi:hypothetical protein
MMNVNLLAGLLAGLLLLGPGAPCSQAENPADAPISSNTLSLEAFLAEAAQKILEYAAQRYNVSIAQAQITKARVCPNPTLGTGAWKDVSGQDMPSIFSLGIIQTFLTLSGNFLSSHAPES